MFFTHNSNPYCINCDWLQFSVKLPNLRGEFKAPRGYRLEVNQGNNIFRKRAILFDHNGIKYLTLLWDPYSRVLDPSIMTVQVANQSLYTGGIRHAWRLLQYITPCTFNSMGRIDICCDFEISQKRLDFIKHLNSGHYYVERKKEGSTFWHEANKNNVPVKQLHCLSWGSKTTEIKVKLYHKSREQGLLSDITVDKDGVIHEPEPEKPWIVNEWRENEMDVQNIWRLEFSLSGAGQLEYEGEKITLDQVADPNWLIGVFIDLYQKRFVVRVNQGRRAGHKNLDRRVFLIDLPGTGLEVHWKEYEDRSDFVDPAVSLLRSMMASLESPTILASVSNYEKYKAAILQIIASCNLYSYFCKTFNETPKSYFDHFSQSVGCGVFEREVSPSKYFL
ncbi:hypothetical protein IKW73_03555 [Candidatus Saccharibacteria bacterium]|nr:hypothetical protein [Candidatus Saccharibacteria bacterium]